MKGDERAGEAGDRCLQRLSSRAGEKVCVWPDPEGAFGVFKGKEKREIRQAQGYGERDGAFQQKKGKGAKKLWATSG